MSEQQEDEKFHVQVLGEHSESDPRWTRLTMMVWPLPAEHLERMAEYLTAAAREYFVKTGLSDGTMEQAAPAANNNIKH